VSTEFTPLGLSEIVGSVVNWSRVVWYSIEMLGGFTASTSGGSDV